MKRLSLSILLILPTFALGPLRMAAQDPSPQTDGPDAPARGVLDKDQQLALMRQNIQSLMKKLIGDNLDLTVTEAAKFWPVYEEYSTDYGKIDEDRSVIVKEYSESFGSVTDTSRQSDSPMAGHGYLCSPAPPEVRAHYPNRTARQESGHVFSTRSAHQHDDRCSDYVSNSVSAERN